MKNDRMFLKCNICGNIIGMIDDQGPTVVCCDQDMELLTPNTSDATKEKHVPVALRKGDEIEVKIGSEPHPMTEEHNISWIVLAGDGWTQRISLENTAAPAVLFCVKEKGPVSVYAYCNLHGLWASEL